MEHSAFCPFLQGVENQRAREKVVFKDQKEYGHATAKLPRIIGSLQKHYCLCSTTCLIQQERKSFFHCTN